MKVGDIKIEALKLMFVNYSFDLGIDDLQSMISDENYGSYIVNMNGAIARALDRIENACIVPIKRYEIPFEECISTRQFLKFDLSAIKDLYIIDRITAEYDGEYDGNVGFSLEGDMLLLPKDSADFTILYYPTIKTIDENVQDTDDIWIPERIARLIPYFIKSELYQEEEPDLAADARNMFEASLEDLKKQTQSKQNYIHKTFRMG
jgi:hypothetical protein